MKRVHHRCSCIRLCLTDIKSIIDRCTRSSQKASVMDSYVSECSVGNNGFEFWHAVSKCCTGFPIAE